MAKQLFQLGAWLAAVSLAGHSNFAGGVAPSDTVMSAATRGFVSVADFKSTEQHWNATQLGQLVKDPSMKPFIDDMKAQIERKMAGTRQKLGLTIEDLREVAAGEIGVGLVEQEKTRAALAVTVDVTGRGENVKQLLAKIDQEMAKRRAKRSSANSSGAELTIYKIPPQSKDDSSREAVFFVQNDLLCASDNRTEAEEMLRRMGGQGGQRLADVKSYQVTMQRCAAEAKDMKPEVRWYVDPFGYARSTRSLLSGEALAKRGKNYLSILENQGFDAIQGVGGYLNLAVDGSYELLHRTSVYAPPIPDEPNKYKLAMQMLKFPNTADLQPEPWAPRKLASYRTFTCDLQNAFKHIDSIFDAIAGVEHAWADVLEGLEKDPYGPQIKVQRDFVAYLGQRVSMTTDYDLPITTKSERFLLTVEVKDEKAIAATVEKYMKADPNAQKREFQGITVWEIMPATEDVPELDIAIDPTPKAGHTGDKLQNTAMSNSAVCVTQGHLFIASHLSYLEQILSQQKEGDEKLTAATDFQEVDAALKRLLGGPVSVRCFRRADEAYRPSYELVRQGKMPESQTLLGRLLNRLLTPPEEEEEGVLRKQKIDGRQLPPFEMVRRYFSPGGTVVRSLDDGWLVVGATLTKRLPQAQAGETPIREAARVR